MMATPSDSKLWLRLDVNITVPHSGRVNKPPTTDVQRCQAAVVCMLISQIAEDHGSNTQHQDKKEWERIGRHRLVEFQRMAKSFGGDIAALSWHNVDINDVTIAAADVCRITIKSEICSGQ
jgi:hypothetical protein